jgi:hypothetical protein
MSAAVEPVEAAVKAYLESLDELERVAYQVAQEVLGDTLVVERTNGFLEFVKKRKDVTPVSTE